MDLVILGKQSIDDDLGATGQMLAGLLNWSQATFASKLDVDVDNGKAVVVREIDGGSEELRCSLPLVVTTDLRYGEKLYSGRNGFADSFVFFFYPFLLRLNGKDFQIDFALKPQPLISVYHI